MRYFLMIALFLSILLMYGAALYGYAPLIITDRRDVTIGNVMINVGIMSVLIGCYSTALMDWIEKEDKKKRQKEDRIIDSIGK